MMHLLLLRLIAVSGCASRAWALAGLKMSHMQLLFCR
jgi:hypothetical protein